MRDLRFVSLTDDGRRAVLASAEGETFAVAVDDTLREAVAAAGPAAAARSAAGLAASGPGEGDQPARPAPDRPHSAGPAPVPPPPREIQARIRGGETAEQIAAQAGVPVELVRRFEGPVLAERAHMVQAAQSAALRRRGDQPPEHLGALVTARLEAHGVPREVLRWDSWLRDDATWLVELRYEAGDTAKRAQWTFDPKRRVVSSADDEARWLSDGHERPEPARERPSVPRLVPAPALIIDEADEADEADERGEPDERIDLDDDAGHAGAGDDGADELDGIRDTGEPDDAGRPAPSSAAAAREARARRHSERLVGATDRQAIRDGVTPGKRAAVPTWDEIVFGTRRRD